MGIIAKESFGFWKLKGAAVNIIDIKKLKIGMIVMICVDEQSSTVVQLKYTLNGLKHDALTLVNFNQRLNEIW